MLLGRDVTEHGAAEPADHRSAYAAGDVIVTGGDVGGQRPQGIERRLVAALQLLVHVLLDQLHGHMAGAFDHGLHIVLPGQSGQLAEGLEFAELGRVVGIGDGARTQAIPQGEGHVVGLHDLADVLEMGIEEVLLMVRQTPLGHDGSATGNDTRDPAGGQRHVAQQYTGVDGEVVHALLGLLDQGVAEDLPVQVLGHSADLFQRLVDGPVPIGTGELRMIHSRVSWIFLPVDRSMMVSAPQRVAQVIFSTSSSMEEPSAELPMLPLIFTRKLRPMIIGSSSGWLMLAGRMARPRAISSRTNSGVISCAMAAPKLCPGCWRCSSPASRASASFMFSRMATNSISGVMMPRRA